MDQEIAAQAILHSSPASVPRNGVEDVPAELDDNTDSKLELLNKALRKVIGTSNSVKPSPESFVKHTDVVGDSPASSRYQHVSRTWFEGGRKSPAQNKAGIEDGTTTSFANVSDVPGDKAHASPDRNNHNDDHQPGDGIESPTAEAKCTSDAALTMTN